MAEGSRQAGEPNNRGARRGVTVAEPQPWYNRFPWALGTLVLNIGIVIFHLGYSSGTGNEKLGNIEKDIGKIERGLESIKGDIGGIKERLVVLERATPRQRRTAAAAGLEDPQFVPVSLSPNSPPQQIVSGTNGPVSYDLEFIFDTVTPEYISFRLGGSIRKVQAGGEVQTFELKNNRIDVQLRPGKPVNLTALVKGMFDIPEIPDIWVAVVDQPSKDKAIIAVGPKISAVS